MIRRPGWLLAIGSGALLMVTLWLRLLAPAGAQTGAPVLITAVLYDGFALGDADEAVQIQNVTAGPLTVTGWSLADAGGAQIVLQLDQALAPGQSLWLAKERPAFERHFGHPPDYAADDEGTPAPLEGSWPGFSNSGDSVALRDSGGNLVDALVYEDGDTRRDGWSGPAVQPYRAGSLFGEEGQILYRRLEPQADRPVRDTDAAGDWAQSDDPLVGRRVRYPGWALERYWQPARITGTAQLTVAIAPDNAYEAIVDEIAGAETEILAAALTFEHVGLAGSLVAAAGRGVSVTVLLEGGPAGGISDQERYVCRALAEAGAACWFMISDGAQRIHARYRYLHGKFIILDGERAVVASENLSPNSLPDDDKKDGTWGRRGVVLITDAPGVVAHLQGLFADDFDPAAHHDLLRWSPTHPVYGPPPAGFVPVTATGGTTYTVRFAAPRVVSGTLAFEIVQAPENALQPDAGLPGLLARAGAGDTILAQQLQERPFWGSSSSNAVDDPNVRLEAMIGAARRGARVQILLDDYFDDPGSPTSNSAACSYVNAIAAAERLALRCQTGNPTGLGIHNKMVLVQLQGRGYVHVGSWNGSEMSAKGNREVALQVQSDDAYELLAEMFAFDWPRRLLFPLIVNAYRGRAGYPLISEVLYNPAGPDDHEFIEIVNPASLPVDLSGYGIGDALHPEDYEDLRRFPPGTTLAPGATLVVATAAVPFRLAFGQDPDFEILGSDPLVPDLIDDPSWGDPGTFLQLGNSGDEVILRSPANAIVDAIGYGSGAVPGAPSCLPLDQPGSVLERFPYWRDSDDCEQDFRAWPFPSPHELP